VGSVIGYNVHKCLPVCVLYQAYECAIYTATTAQLLGFLSTCIMLFFVVFHQQQIKFLFQVENFFKSQLTESIFYSIADVHVLFWFVSKPSSCY